jgi:hypothetical protein
MRPPDLVTPFLTGATENANCVAVTAEASSTRRMCVSYFGRWTSWVRQDRAKERRVRRATHPAAGCGTIDERCLVR